MHREGVPAHKNDAIRALAARRELAISKTDKTVTDRNPATKSTTSLATSSETTGHVTPRDSMAPPTSTPPKLSARARFAHLLKPVSPKIKPFKSISVSSPTKSPAK